MENIYVQLEDIVYQQIGIPMGTNCAPLIADLFLCCEEFVWVWIGCLTSQLTIFQSYMRRHIDVQADRRSSWTYGRAPNAIDIS